jgi:DHA2 family multidrug resistance protein-like MFS transporter
MRETTPPAAAPRAGRREWTGLAVLALPTLLISLDVGALFLALPRLSADLGTTSTQQLWVSDSYGFTLAGFLITIGTLGDRIGRRRLMLIGAAAFGVVSVLAAYSTSPEMLIVSRGLLGVAGATLMPSILATINAMFTDPRQRGSAIALWATCQFSGAALGPVFGGLLLDRFWWGSIFLMGVPVMLLLMVLGPRLLPESRNPDAGRLELASVVLSLGAVLSMVYGLKELVVGDTGGVGVPVAAIALGAALGVAFVRRQFALADPLLDLGLFRLSQVRTVLIAMLLTGVALSGTGMLVSQYMQSVLGYSPSKTALLYAPMGLALAAGSMLTPLIVKRVPPGTAITLGLALTVLGFVSITFTGATTGIVWAVLGIAVMALGDGPLVALGTGIVIGSTPPERAGSAASLSETSLHIGGTLGMAFLGTVGAAVYRGRMDDSMPADLANDAAQAARSTIGGASDAATQLPADPAGDLLRAAAEAFTAGLHAAAWIGAALVAALTVLCWFVLPRRDGAPAAPAEPAHQEAGSGNAQP